VGTNVSGL